jgi:hypothetical protein
MPKLNNKRTRRTALKRWKTFNEKEILDAFYDLDSNWSRKTINYVAKIVKLTEEQIYKWGYEKKRRSTDDHQLKSSKVDETRSEVLNINTGYINYNKLVDEMFPNEGLTDDKLTKQEKKIYDALKNTVMKKDKCIKEMNELDQILYERLPTKSIDEMEKSTKRRETSDSEEESVISQTTFMSRVNSHLISISPKKKDIKLADKETSYVFGISQYAESCLFTDIQEISDEDEKNLFFDELPRMPDFPMIDETISLFEF